MAISSIVPTPPPGSVKQSGFNVQDTPCPYGEFPRGKAEDFPLGVKGRIIPGNPLAHAPTPEHGQMVLVLGTND